jgi:Domain of unknown function (DUF4129)
MSRRLLLPLGLAVTGLLVLAAVASRGRPLRGGRSSGAGPTAGFFDYVLTSLVLVGALVIAVSVWAFLTSPPGSRRMPPTRRRYISSLMVLVLATAIAWLLVRTGFTQRLQKLAQQQHPRQGTSTVNQLKPPPPGTRGARIRWDEVAVVLGLLAAAGVILAAGRSRARAPALGWRRASQAAISAALDESLDDLRAEPDLRKAIIAAYARMEHALALVGLARRPAEAPLEYLARALVELETSAAAVTRLTDLFEWAKFSQHDPEPPMRDEAIDALVAVRDELRAPVEPVAA